ncbi:MAG TPA: hypothetical protein VF062_14775 [Candidatus Limnocylindrales bacterium]
MSIPRGIVTLVSVVAVAVTVASFTGPAAAAGRHPSASAAGPGTIGAEAVAEVVFTPMASARTVLAPRVITCRLAADGPIAQGVDVVVSGLAYCSYTISGVDLTVELYRNDNLWGMPGFDYGRSAAAAPAMGFCIDGAYHGKAIGYFTAPIGYEPPTAKLEAFTGRTNIEC